MKLRALAPLAAIALLTLAGCSDSSTEDQDSSPSPSATSASASATPSATSSEATPSPTESATPEPTEPEVPLPAEPSASETPVQAAPEEVAPEQPAPAEAAAPTVEDFFATGGQCISDAWSSSIPRTDELQAQVNDYCAANQLGDWSYGFDPMDPDSYQQESDPYGIGPFPAEEEPQQSDAQREEDIANCQSRSREEAPSGVIQYCYMEYGIEIN
jgi:hypothetical protein